MSDNRRNNFNAVQTSILGEARSNPSWKCVDSQASEALPEEVMAS